MLKTYFKNIVNACVSIFEGMAVTFSYMFRKPITIQYPDRTPKPVADMLTPGFRGILEVDTRICSGCLACMKRCPIGTIYIETERDPETKKNYLTRFDIDVARCMVCGLCTEVCPTGAIRHATEFEAATANVINLVMNYVKPGDKIPTYKLVKDQEPQGAPQNAPYRQIKKKWDDRPPVAPDTVRGEARWRKRIKAEEVKA
jgi:formate hydrogenlyase subunit 6/NADH:ubiquinone oxidoreductase subunit I